MIWSWFVDVVDRIRAVEVAAVKDRLRTWPPLVTYVKFNQIRYPVYCSINSILPPLDLLIIVYSE